MKTIRYLSLLEQVAMEKYFFSKIDQLNIFLLGPINTGQILQNLQSRKVCQAQGSEELQSRKTKGHDTEWD